MASETFEYDVNRVIKDLVDGLNGIADKVEDGSREEIACLIRELAGKICEHWPECLASISRDDES